MVRKRSR